MWVMVVLPVSSHLFNGDLAQNQLEVKNFFKALGFKITNCNYGEYSL
jgi:hypothetical protein